MLRDKIEELSLHRSENRACRNVSSLSEKSGLLEKHHEFFFTEDASFITSRACLRT